MIGQLGQFLMKIPAWNNIARLDLVDYIVVYNKFRLYVFMYHNADLCWNLWLLLTKLSARFLLS